jgi:hypothetical protein
MGGERLVERIVYPAGYLDVQLPPEKAAVGFGVGYGGLAALVARAMLANADLLYWRAPLHFAAGRDSLSERAEWLGEVARYVTRYPPDRELEVISSRRKSLGERISEFFVREVAVEVNLPPSFEMLGGSLPARVTPYGHRPDKMAIDFELWRGTVEADARRIAQNMRRRRASRGSLAIFGRSIGSHEMACAYGQWLLKSELQPNYVVSILPVFAEEREELLAYISLVKEFGVPRNELLVPYAASSEFGSLPKSDIVFLTTFLLNAMCSQRPDVVTLVEKARQRSPFAGIIMKRELIPIRYIKTSREIMRVIRIPGAVVGRPDSNYELTVETLLSDLHLEMASLEDATPVAIFLHGPFTEEEARKLEEAYSRQYPVVVGYGGSGREGDFAEVYGVGLFVLNDSKALPPHLARTVGVSSVDEVELKTKSHMEEGYEILSKFCGVEVGELFRRGEGK